MDRLVSLLLRRALPSNPSPENSTFRSFQTGSKQFLLLIALLLPVLRAAALDITKSADDYFHNGAMSYLSNNIPAALNVVTNGLEQYPNDEKLKKLEALLKQQQQQQQNQQDQQQNQDQQKDQQQSESKDQNDKDQQSKQEQQQQQQSQQQEQQKKDQDSQQKTAQSGDKDKQDAQGQAASASDQQQEMTPEQALRVLDSTKGDEKVLPLQQQPPPPSSQIFKDW